MVNLFIYCNPQQRHGRKLVFSQECLVANTIQRSQSREATPADFTATYIPWRFRKICVHIFNLNKAKSGKIQFPIF